jgi:glutamate-ammonia-ligase adenylyltransferase
MTPVPSDVRDRFLAAVSSGALAADDADALARGSHLAEPAASAAHLAATLALLPDADPALLAETGLASFDPDRFFVALRRLAEQDATRAVLRSALPDAAGRDRLAVLIAGSPFLADAVLRDAGLLADALAPSFPGPPDGRLELAADAADDGLAAFKLRETLRVALADLSRAWPPEAVLARISDLAAAVLARALAATERDLARRVGVPRNLDPDRAGEPADFVVLGMGKLGGRELNFSSDVDLIYVHRTERGTTTGGAEGAVTNAEYYVRLARELTRRVAAPGEGALYRVDLGLRPGGRSGDASISLSGAETYYEYWGENWERQAMISCRPVAGSIALGEAFLERMRPFVWRRSLDLRYVQDLRRMKRRIEKSLAARRGQTQDVKLSRGGIREVEFVVQAFQLVYGGKDQALRVRGTLPALAALAAGNYLPPADVEALRAAYLFLRELENRIQVLENRQTHEVPPAPRERAALARKMGLDAGNAEASARRLMEVYERHRRAVMAVFDGMFPAAADEGGEGEAAGSAEPAASLATDESREGLRDLLAGSGFVDPARAADDLIRLRDGAGGALVTASSKERFSVLLPELIEIAARLPDPDRAVDRLEKFARALGSREALFATLADSPEWAESLLSVLGSSEYLAAILIGQPDFLESVFRPEYLGRPMDAAEIARAMAGQLAEARGTDAALRELRRIKRAQELRIGLRHLLLRPGIRRTMEELTALADATVAAALDLARAEAQDAEGTAGPPRVRVAVFALGSLGAGELVFNSDLDLLFLYEEGDDGLDADARAVLATRVAERTVRGLAANLDNGFAYRVDLRLRPEGTHGPLAVRASAFFRYLAERAAVWELQSLVRLRPVAGEPSLVHLVGETVRRRLADSPLSAGDARAVLAMRERMARDLARKGRSVIDLKFARGGLVDAEFVAQVLALSGSGVPDRDADPAGGTLAILGRAAAAGLLAEDDRRDLAGAFLFQKRLENQLRLTFERPLSHVDRDSPALGLVARLMGYLPPGEADALLADLSAHRARMREAADRVAAGITRTA